jgi:hypothetical protein
VHWIKLPSQVASGRRPVQNYVHAVLGLLIIALAFFQVRTGYSVELPKYAGINAPRLADAAWTTWAMVSSIPSNYDGVVSDRISFRLFRCFTLLGLPCFLVNGSRRQQLMSAS